MTTACVECGETLDVAGYHGETRTLRCMECTGPEPAMPTATAVRGVSERRTWSSRTGRSRLARP